MNNDIIERLKANLNKNGLVLLTNKDNVNTTKQMIVISDGKYKANVKLENYLRNDRKCKPLWFAVKNPFIIENINTYYRIQHDGKFICISNIDEIVDRNSVLRFQCTRCGQIIEKSIFNALRHDGTHNGIKCSNCDEHFESLHALVLKQVFKHYYPDSVEEDPSCRNPKTGKIMATDIVNHRLKIAIEVQGQWHRFEKQKQRDKIKKEFWLSRGYAFYDYEIENVSVLQYIQYFFPNIKDIPDWVNMNYNKKLNIVEIQKYLNGGFKVQDIAKKLGINPHRIYDALHDNKLYYPDKYSKISKRPIIMLDLNKNKIREYDSYSEAERDNSITDNLIASCVFTKKYYCSGYYWIPKDLYESGNYQIPIRRTDKFYQKVNKYDINDNFIASFDDMYEAAKDIDTIASKIYEVIKGYKKSTKGYKYRLA